MQIFYKIFITLTGSGAAFAQNGEGTAPAKTLPSFDIINPVGFSGSVGEIVDRIINLLLLVGAPLATLMYVWAGFQFLSSAGDEKKISVAKKTVLWTTIGIAVLILSKGIILSVKNLLSP